PISAQPCYFNASRTSSCIAFNFTSSGSSLASGKLFGPSESAAAGLSCTSMNTPSTPHATPARQVFNKLGISAACRAQSSGPLKTVSNIVHNRIPELSHDRDAAKIDDEIVIAKTR